MLTPAQFLALVKAKGYRLVDLARLWNLSSARISQIVRDPERPAYLNYALWGLPTKSRADRVARERARAALDAERRFPSLRKQRKRSLPGRAQTMSLPFQKGDGVCVLSAQGEHLPEGTRGAVIERDRDSAWIAFETSYVEKFSMAYLLSPSAFLMANGQVYLAAQRYQFTSSDRASLDVQMRRLQL